MQKKSNYDRRGFLLGSGALAGATAAGTLLPTGIASAQQGKIKVGLMLPSTGTFAQLGACHHQRFQAGGRRTRRQARRARDRILYGG